MLVIRGSCFDSHFEGLELCNLPHFYMAGWVSDRPVRKTVALAMIVGVQDKGGHDQENMKV